MNTKPRNTYLSHGKNGLCSLLFALILGSLPLMQSNASNELPTIVENISAASQAQEKLLGKAWLHQYRRQVPIETDPYLTEYTEKLLLKLARNNPDAGNDFSLVIVKNPNLNAFAVPGGIIGINSGLFNYAQTEDQFASVIAHELAHLSQRHYARRVEKQKGQQILSMAALLGGLIIAATGNSEAGIAAIQATQAGIIDQQLRFSRTFEQEADRIGMQTLVESGFDPHSMTAMFEQMQRASQYSFKPPEFLLTHPVTASRIADAENRARNFPDQNAPSSLEYDLLRSRILFKNEETPQQAIARFKSELNGFSPSTEGSRYGLALSYIASKQFDKAEDSLKLVLEKHPNNPILISANADIVKGKGDTSGAIALIQAALKNNPTHYPLNIQLSQFLAANNDFISATSVVESLIPTRPEDPYIWFNLAEFAGLAGDILTLHKARAEYFMLYGDYNSAENQLNNLIRKFGENKLEVSIAQKRLNDIKNLKENSPFN